MSRKKPDPARVKLLDALAAEQAAFERSFARALAWMRRCAKSRERLRRLSKRLRQHDQEKEASTP